MCDLSELLLKSEILANSLNKSINVNVIVITEHDFGGVISVIGDDARHSSQIKRGITLGNRLKTQFSYFN